jgi:hypothetical protein
MVMQITQMLRLQGAAAREQLPDDVEVNDGVEPFTIGGCCGPCGRRAAGCSGRARAGAPWLPRTMHARAGAAERGGWCVLPWGLGPGAWGLGPGAEQAPASLLPLGTCRWRLGYAGGGQGLPAACMMATAPRELACPLTCTAVPCPALPPLQASCPTAARTRRRLARGWWASWGSGRGATWTAGPSLGPTGGRGCSRGAGLLRPGRQGRGGGPALPHTSRPATPGDAPPTPQPPPHTHTRTHAPSGAWRC